VNIIKKRASTLESELGCAHKQFAENHRRADQLLWQARAVAEATRKRAMTSTRIADWLSHLML